MILAVDCYSFENTLASKRWWIELQNRVWQNEEPTRHEDVCFFAKEEMIQNLTRMKDLRLIVAVMGRYRDEFLETMNDFLLSGRFQKIYKMDRQC